MILPKQKLFPSSTGVGPSTHYLDSPFSIWTQGGNYQSLSQLFVFVVLLTWDYARSPQWYWCEHLSMGQQMCESGWPASVIGQVLTGYCHKPSSSQIGLWIQDGLCNELLLVVYWLIDSLYAQQRHISQLSSQHHQIPSQSEHLCEDHWYGDCGTWTHQSQL